MNVRDESIGVIDLLSYNEKISKVVMYKDKIFLIDYENGSRIDMYDLSGNFIKTVFGDGVNGFAVIDNAVYFYPIK